MPIRVECPHCRKLTYFADNDAGLAVSCLACKAHLRVPAATPAPKAAAPVALPDEPPPLFANTPRHLLAAPITAETVSKELPTERQAPRQRRLRPASPRSRWRLYAIIVAIPAAVTLAMVLKHRHVPQPQEQVRQDQPTTHPPGATQVAIAPSTRATPKPPVDSQPKNKPAIPAAPPASKPVLASITPAAPLKARDAVSSYTPAAAPVGFVGLERIDLAGRTLIDSYSSDVGPYSRAAARANAILLSNGPIGLNADGDIRAAVHAGVASNGKARKNLTITGSTERLAARLSAPSVELDPFAHDSANSALPGEVFKSGNFFLRSKHPLSLPGGVYYVNDFTVDAAATLRLEGPVTVLASGQVCIYGMIETCEGRPAHLRIRSTGEKPVNIARNNALFLDLYAPQSAIQISGNGDIFGSIVGKTLRINGARNLHFDETLQFGR